MAVRTDPDLVKDVLQRDYDSRNQPPLTRFIVSASLIVDQYVACAALRNFTVSAELALEIETWVAAYRYTHNNPVYSSKSTDGRSASFVRQGGGNPYRAGALELDPVGCLEVLLKIEGKKRVGFSWMGKTRSEAQGWDERDAGG